MRSLKKFIMSFLIFKITSIISHIHTWVFICTYLVNSYLILKVDMSITPEKKVKHGRRK